MYIVTNSTDNTVRYFADLELATTFYNCTAEITLGVTCLLEHEIILKCFKSLALTPIENKYVYSTHSQIDYQYNRLRCLLTHRDIYQDFLNSDLPVGYSCHETRENSYTLYRPDGVYITTLHGNDAQEFFISVLHCGDSVDKLNKLIASHDRGY